MDSKFDIKSSTIEKGLEIAKNFVDKLIMPSVEETGLLVKDQITLWRFKNQIKMLNKANTYCEKYNIEPKKITLKVLAPLLEYSSLEEDEQMQDKWSLLLSNLIDSEQNIENHVFPYILSQLSKDEFFPLEKVYNSKVLRTLNLYIELKNFREERPQKEKKLNQKIEELEMLLQEKRKQNTNKGWNKEIWDIEKEQSEIKRNLRNIGYEEHKILHSLLKAERIPDETFKEFELSNLIRLGLVKEIREFYAPNQTLEIPNDKENEWSYINVDLDIEMESTIEYILTELGELFFKACQEKDK